MGDYGDECLASAKKFANVARKDDIVIMLWSYSYYIQRQLYSLLTGTEITVSNFHLFAAHHITYPKSGDQVLLVSAPGSGYSWDAQTKEGLQHILPHINQKQIRFIAHVWIHDITRSDLLHDDGKPKDWDALKTIFGGVIEMNQVTFLSTRFGETRKGQWQLQKIQKGLMEDIQKGLIFEELGEMTVENAWQAVSTACPVSWATEEYRVKKIQHDIDNLRVELLKTAKGQTIYALFQDIWEKEREYLVTTFDQIDKEDNSLIKKKLEREVDWEYMMYRKKMWTLFEECGFLKIPVGRHLKEFYGFEVFPEPPKKSIFERILKRVKN